LTSQLLAGTRARHPVEVADRTLAVQAQDLRGAMLAVRARSVGVTSADVERALTVDRSLVITWLSRGTLHLARSQDYHWLLQLTASRSEAGATRWLAQQGVSANLAERGVAAITRGLTKDGPLTRAQLRQLLLAAGLPDKAQVPLHLLFLASLRGLVVRGPMIGREQAFVLVRDWLAETKPVLRERALVELARRYLAGHGPASDRDLARWSGLPLGEARTGLAALGSDLKVRAGGLLDFRGGLRRLRCPDPSCWANMTHCSWFAPSTDAGRGHRVTQASAVVKDAPEFRECFVVKNSNPGQLPKLGAGLQPGRGGQPEILKPGHIAERRELGEQLLLGRFHLGPRLVGPKAAVGDELNRLLG
jgi:hypothetical protein